MSNFEDGHNRLETPVLIPNTEVKLPMLVAVVSKEAKPLSCLSYSFSLFLYNVDSFFLYEYKKG